MLPDSLAPTPSPNVKPGNITCGDEPIANVEPGDEQLIYIMIPLGTQRLIVSLCNDITDFPTRLELQDSDGNLLEADEGGCGAPYPRASILNTTRFTTDRRFGQYILTVRGVDLTDFGIFLMSTECIVNVSPLESPTPLPTRQPTEPTLEPTMMEETPDPTPTMSTTITAYPTPKHQYWSHGPRPKHNEKKQDAIDADCND